VKYVLLKIGSEKCGLECKIFVLENIFQKEISKIYFEI